MSSELPINPSGSLRGVPLAPRMPPAVVTFSEARRAEITEDVRAGLRRRSRHSVYVPTPSHEASDAQRREHDALADIAAVAERLTNDHVFSHTSAALLHGCWIMRTPTHVHVCQRTMPNSAKRADPCLRRHRIDVPEPERTDVFGVPVTTLERTVVDCACLLPAKESIVVMDSAIRAGADNDEIDRILETRAHTRGIRRARQVVAAGDATSESPGESIVRWILIEAGMPVPETQIRVETRRGTKWLDLGWPNVKVGIEFDGAVKYGSGDDVFAEKLRHDAIVEAGWRLIRVTWSDLHDSAALVRRIRAALR